MIDEDLAVAKVLAHLRSMESTDCPLALVRCEERPFGWIFYYNSAKFVQTGDFIAQLAGNGPIVVDRDSGELSVLHTCRSIETQIDEFERSCARRQAARLQEGGGTTQPPR